MRRPRDQGYAMLAAVAGIAAFAYIAFELLASNRGELIGLSAEVQKARMTAAAEAGVMTAIQGLAATDVTRRWSITGGAHALSFDGMALTISVEDERGKVPINSLDDDQARKLFEVGGASGDRLAQLLAGFQDWQDQDSDRRRDGAEAADYLPAGIRPRNGAFRTVDEMSRLKAMDPELLARLRPLSTVFFGKSGGFSQRSADPRAIAVMTAAGAASPDVIAREREMAGERPALEISDDDLKGRPLTVRVDVDDGHGGRLERAMIVELTGNPANPYWIRLLD